MSNRIMHTTLALAAAFMLNSAAVIAAPAASPKATATTAAPKEKTVEGTITKWDDKTQTFQTKATVETWTFSFDKTKLKKIGTPAVGSRIKISYHMNGKVYVADTVEVEKKK